MGRRRKTLTVDDAIQDLFEAKPYRIRSKPEEELSSKKDCPGCNQPLHQQSWNTVVDILFCINRDCAYWHLPAGRVPIFKTSMLQLAKEWDEKVHKKEFWRNGEQAIKYGLSDGYPK